MEESAESAMVPAAWPIQPRDDAKQPAESERPLLNVEVAPEVRRILPEEMRKPPAEASDPAVTPPVNVDVALVVAVKNDATASPSTESGAYGDVVPMPSLSEK